MNDSTTLPTSNSFDDFSQCVDYLLDCRAKLLDVSRMISDIEMTCLSDEADVHKAFDNIYDMLDNLTKNSWDAAFWIKYLLNQLGLDELEDLGYEEDVCEYFSV